ncbi:phosphatase PAP2 family protein [Capnocytophaga sp. ARDL2]|uniref:phosphatase PAP2 family protein n=1 Tax=Capnocytophaga sp. ARDL2 TaxID=3238809 RepID=UPI0035577C69
MTHYSEKTFHKLPSYLMIAPLLVIFLILGFIIYNNALSADGYVNIQKSWFYFLNKHLSRFPDVQNNLTQLGDAFIVLSLLSVFYILYPNFWHVLIRSSILSLFLSKIPKSLFYIPRPATCYELNTFQIIGKKIVGFSSCPSGHSITIFTWLVVVLLFFSPEKRSYRFIYWLIGLSIGLFIALSRVAVGAHHPLDVLLGSSLGAFAAIIGLLSVKKFNFFEWMSNRKYHPIFIALFSISAIVLCIRIYQEPLTIYFFSLLSLCFAIYLTTKKYYERKNIIE